MKFIVLLLLLSISLYACDLEFDTYCREFGKSYQEEEYEEAKACFYQNVERNKKVNEKQSSYKAGCTIFTDMCDQKVSARFHVMHDDKGPFQKPPQHNLQPVGSPTSVDWRDEGKISAVKDQGTCGSCWVFLTTAMYEHTLYSNNGTEYDLSEEYILECTTEYFNNGYDSSCAGGYVDFSIPFIHQTGCPTEEDYPYTASNYGSSAGHPITPGICNSTTNIMAEDSNISFNKYQDLTDDETYDLLLYNPLGALMYVESGIYSYSEGVYSGCPSYNDSVAQINHAVVIVGRTEDGHWIIKNSWGTSWGEQGFAIIDKDYDCGLKYRLYQLRGSNGPLSSGFFLLFSIWVVLATILMI